MGYVPGSTAEERSESARHAANVRAERERANAEYRRQTQDALIAAGPDAVAKLIELAKGGDREANRAIIAWDIGKPTQGVVVSVAPAPQMLTREQMAALTAAELGRITDAGEDPGAVWADHCARVGIEDGRTQDDAA